MRNKLLAICAIMAFSFCWTYVSAQDFHADMDKVSKAFVEASVATYSVGDDVWNRFIKDSGHWTSDEKALRRIYTSSFPSDAEAERILKKFDFGEGRFTDIDYDSKFRSGWPPATHLSRMESLAKLYVAGPDRWRGSERLKTFLHMAMAYWFRTMPNCPNWWHNVVNTPRKMSEIMIMLRDELTEEEFAGGLKVLEPCTLGQSIWRGGTILLKGIMTCDEDLVMLARDDIVGRIRITNVTSGIHDDLSYQHHGAQMQFGYGLDYADGLAFWCRVLAGTKYAFPEEKIKILSDFLKEGVTRGFFKGMWDPNLYGRSSLSNIGRRRVRSLAMTAQNMAVAMERMAETAEGESAAYYRSEAAFYNALSKETLYLNDSRLNGAKYFNRSDCGIYRTKDWYSSIRMQSERTIGFEYTNNMNTLGNFTADGAMILMQDGGEYDNIFACRDWRMVPGVTAYDDGKPIKHDDSLMGKRNKTAHVGGLTAKTPVGDVMATSMELNRDGLHAFKSNFFFGDCIISLGSDIRVTNPDIKSVTTAVDQTRLKGETTYGKSSLGSDGNVRTGVKWVHHNNRGYVSLDGSTMNVSEAVQKGQWSYIQPELKEKWEEMPIFRCWFDHPVGKLRGKKSGGYAYAILPCTSASDTETFEKEVSKGGKDAPVRVLSNTADCQAVSHNGVVCAVLHKAGKYKLDGETVESERPCIIIREGNNVSTEWFEEEIVDVAERVFARASSRRINNMRNEVTKRTEVAVKDHFREDGGTWHLVGHDGSSQSMDKVWELYGYTMAYRFTKDKSFRNQAQMIAEHLLPRIPEDGIPYWDYDAPNIPNEEKDASAAAVMASALIELSGYVSEERASWYQNVARKILRTLGSDEYLAQEGEIQGFLLKHSVGSKPGNSEVEVPLTYADYYFLEALMRYLELEI